jgi:hypothetical protein
LEFHRWVLSGYNTGPFLRLVSILEASHPLFHGQIDVVYSQRPLSDILTVTAEYVRTNIFIQSTNAVELRQVLVTFCLILFQTL